MTSEQLKRLGLWWNGIASEQVEIEAIGGAVYAYGSELATLRLFKAYSYLAHTGKIAADYSVNLQTHFFRMDAGIEERSIAKKEILDCS